MLWTKSDNVLCRISFLQGVKVNCFRFEFRGAPLKPFRYLMAKKNIPEGCRTVQPENAKLYPREHSDCYLCTSVFSSMLEEGFK